MVQKRQDPSRRPGYRQEAPTHLHKSDQSADAPRRPTKPADQDSGSAGGPTAYDVPEVLRRLSVTRPTIYRFLRSGELRSFRLGSRRLISSEALADFIRSRESAEAG